MLIRMQRRQVAAVPESCILLPKITACTDWNWEPPCFHVYCVFGFHSACTDVNWLDARFATHEQIRGASTRIVSIRSPAGHVAS